MITKINELRSQVRTLSRDLINGRLKSKVKYNKLRDQLFELEKEYEVTVLYPEVDKLDGQWITGIVHSVNSRGDMMIKSEYGTIWGYIQNDVNSKSWYAETCCIEYTEGQSIRVQLRATVDDCLIHLEAGKIEGGKVNESKYTELCQRDDLVFFKKPDGSMSGLGMNIF